MPSEPEEIIDVSPDGDKPMPPLTDYRIDTILNGSLVNITDKAARSLAREVKAWRAKYPDAR